MIAGITGAFGVSREDDNVKRVEFFTESGLCAGNTYFEHKSLNKYTRGTRSQDEVEINGMIDLVLVKKDMLHYVQEVRAVRIIGLFFSDIHLVLCKARLVGAWIKGREVYGWI